MTRHQSTLIITCDCPALHTALFAYETEWMCAYTKHNGQHSTTHHTTLENTLHDTIAFGILMFGVCCSYRLVCSAARPRATCLRSLVQSAYQRCCTVHIDMISSHSTCPKALSYGKRVRNSSLLLLVVLLAFKQRIPPVTMRRWVYPVTTSYSHTPNLSNDLAGH